MAGTTKPKKEAASKTEKATAKITKEMPIMQIVRDHPETFDVFMKYGMHCIGCAAARFENLDQGCQAHGIDTEKFVKDLNAAVDKAEKEKKQKSK